MALHSFFLYTLLTSSLSFSVAVNYIVTNESPESPPKMHRRFTKEIGIPFTKEVMGKCNNIIWSTIFKQNTPADRKHVDTVEVFINSINWTDGVTWGNNKINVSCLYLEAFSGDVKYLISSILCREMTRVFQWDGEGKCPRPLLEGIAEYTTLIAKVPLPIFVKPGEGDRWDKGWSYTTRFLEYCDGLVPGFVTKLNAMMRKTYDVSFFKNLTGKPVELLWKEYKAKYVGKN